MNRALLARIAVAIAADLVFLTAFGGGPIYFGFCLMAGVWAGLSNAFEDRKQ